MKFKYLSVIPLVCMLASCGSDPMASVSQSLPSDVEQVNSQTEQVKYAAAVEKAIAGFDNLDYYGAMYHLSLNYSVSEVMAGQGMSASVFASVSGDLTFGFETVSERMIHAYSGAFIKLSNFSLNFSSVLPEAIKEYYPIPEQLNFSNINMAAYIFEGEDGATLYADLSDYNLQNAIQQGLALSGMPEEGKKDEKTGEYVYGINDVMDTLLGERPAGSLYRPGKVSLNLSALLAAYAEENPDAGISQSEIEKPLTFAIEEMKSYVGEALEDIVGYLPMVCAALQPVVGVKTEQALIGEQVVKTSVVMNVSSADIINKFQIPAEQFPVNGYAGLMFSVGTDAGSKYPALEELKLSVNASINQGQGVNASINGSLSLDAHYDEQVELPTLSEQEIKEYNDITEEILDLVFPPEEIQIGVK